MCKKSVVSFLFIIIYCLFPNQSAQAQSVQQAPQNYRAVKWTMQDGLSFEGFVVVFKDSRGFLWAGNTGSQGELSRFDGFRFKKFLPAQNNQTINSNHIVSFVEDSLNNIWIGTDKGVTRYDIEADTFTHFLMVPDNNSARSAPFWSTKNEVYCKEPGGLITAFNIRTLMKDTVVKLSSEDDPEIHQNPHHSFFDSRSNSFWFLDFSDTVDGKDLLQVFPDGRLSRYRWPCYREKIKHQRHNAEDMVFDRGRYSVWVSSGDGLLEFSLSDMKFRQIPALASFEKTPGYDRYVGIDLDKWGRVWFATTKGILFYDPESEKLQQALSDPESQIQIGEHSLRVYCDRDGMVWSSYYVIKGLNQFLPYNPPVKRYTADSKLGELSNMHIMSLVPGPAGRIWVGTADGLNIFDPETEKFELIRTGDLKGVRGKYIQPLFVDTSKQIAWIKTGIVGNTNYFDINVYEMDILTGKCNPVVFRNGSRQLDSVAFENYMVKPFKQGLLICDEKYGLFEIKENSQIAELQITFESNAGEVFLNDQYLFIAGSKSFDEWNLSFTNENGKWEKISHMLDSVQWSSMIYNPKDQTYWVSFKYELVHYNKDFEKIKVYRFEDGYNHTILNMLLDDSGHLWYTNILKQICRLDPVTGIITTLSESEGYFAQNYNWFSSGIKDSRGQFYFGEPDPGTEDGGLDRVYPERFSAAATSIVYLSSFSINNKARTIQNGLNSIQSISLKHFENDISIETGVIDFYARGKNHIRYKLESEGKIDEWQYAPAYNTIRYEGLEPGTYKLVIQSSNTGNVFNSEYKTLELKIKPAFWQTWWFRVSVVMLTGILFYLVIRFRTQQIFRQKLERSERERNFAELRQQKTEIEMQALRAQMNPHFIFNSLNSINRFILQNNKAQASEYLTKFSRLVRLILQNSQSSMITLESELDSLRLYLDLEAVRFEQRFAYTITVPKDLDVEMLKVPPLIIQPYTENAIWHGLMHREENGQLDISVNEEDDHLVIRIADNGIGREAARAISGKSATKHKSFGMKITASRIAMLEKTMDGVSPVTINDLSNPDGSAAGTQVVIRIPVQYNA